MNRRKLASTIFCACLLLISAVELIVIIDARTQLGVYKQLLGSLQAGIEEQQTECDCQVSYGNDSVSNLADNETASPPTISNNTELQEFPLDNPLEEYEIFINEIYGYFFDKYIGDDTLKESVLVEICQSYLVAVSSLNHPPQDIIDVLNIPIEIMRRHLDDGQFNSFTSFEYNLVANDSDLLSYISYRYFELIGEPEPLNELGNRC